MGDAILGSSVGGGVIQYLGVPRRPDAGKKQHGKCHCHSPGPPRVC